MEAEYRFAVSSATMAGRWAAIEADGDAFNLQYRTAGDDRVRDSHAALDMITLPPSDPFWSSFSFPNGWRCRCSYVQVRKSKYPLSDSAEAIRLAEEATTQIDKDGKNRLEIFRFNPGKDKVIFPPHHPYRKVQDADKVYQKASKEARREIVRMTFEKPLSEQYSAIYKTKSGGEVEVHELAGIGKDEYNAKIQAAKLFADQGKKVKVLPARVGDAKFREKLYPGYSNNYKNPDFLIDGKYYDLKAIENVDNIRVNANKASKQDAIAIISDFRLKGLNSGDVERLGDGITSQDKDLYKFNSVWFVINNELKEYKRKRAT